MFDIVLIILVAIDVLVDSFFSILFKVLIYIVIFPYYFLGELQGQIYILMNRTVCIFIVYNQQLLASINSILNLTI